MKTLSFLAGLLFSLMLSFTAFSQPTNSPATTPVGDSPRVLDSGILNVLTPEQRRSLAPIAREHNSRLSELQSKLRNAQTTLIDTALSTNSNENTVRQQAAAVAGLEAEISVLRLKILSQVKPPLSSDQIDKVKNAIHLGPSQPSRFPIPENRPGRQRILQN
jgi:hypothetical protein